VNYIEAGKAQKRAQEQQRAAYSDAVARENLIAAGAISQLLSRL
jgi:hypothetical protein